MNEKKKKSWIRKRHKIVKNIAFSILYPYARIKYGLRLKKPADGGIGQYLILYNHQTPFDQFFVGMSYKEHVYYLASEDLFSNGFISKLIRYLVAPIPIRKQGADLTAIKNCIRVVKEGGSIAIAPEGNRTYSGATEYMSPSIAPLARKLGLPIVLFRIEGGYGTQPRWSDVIRKGVTKCYIHSIIKKEEYDALSDDELFEKIKAGLYYDENERTDILYKHKKRAELLERVIYVCPKCALSSFESKNERIRCKKCGLSVTYNENLTLSSSDPSFPYKNVKEWYDAQKRFIRELSLSSLQDGEPLYTETVGIKKVVLYKRKEVIAKTSEIRLYTDRITIKTEKEELLFPFDSVNTVTICGRNKMNISRGEFTFQIRGQKSFNAVKYVHFYHKYINSKKGEPNGEFLGL